MAWGSWDKVAADAATIEAKIELERVLAEMSRTERKGVLKIQQWWQEYYNGNKQGRHATGHKALGRILVETDVQP